MKGPYGSFCFTQTYGFYKKKMSSLGHQLFCQPEQLTFWIAASISEEMRRGRTLMLSSTVAIPRWAYTFHLWYKYYNNI